MEIKEIEVFSEQSNYAIVRMPGRHFPGCVVQGDSLSNLLTRVERASALATDTASQELIDEIDGLKDLLEDRIRHYEMVIKNHGLELPYRRPREI